MNAATYKDSDSQSGGGGGGSWLLIYQLLEASTASSVKREWHPLPHAWDAELKAARRCVKAARRCAKRVVLESDIKYEPGWVSDGLHRFSKPQFPCLRVKDDSSYLRKLPQGHSGLADLEAMSVRHF